MGPKGEMAYPFPIDRNVIPRCDAFIENGYTKEEMKLVNETRKILDPSIRVTATAVRVPVTGGHSEAVNVEFERSSIWRTCDACYVKLLASCFRTTPAKDVYPMPLTAHDRDAVFVGRLRRDETQPRTLNLWIVADNLRKGAATNAVQIAEHLVRHGLLKPRKVSA
jgi:aspartate-semialdehyde dehydrogenase